MIRPVLKKLESKRNDVYAIKYKNKQFIVKIYKNKDSRVMEEKTLKRLNKHGLNVPKVVNSHKNILITEFIDGKTIGEAIHTSADWVEDLAKWLAKLHNIKHDETTILKGDCNLKNFIFTKKGVYGIDFENTFYGDPIHDLGEICFFIIDSTSTLKRKTKEKIIKKFIQNYQKHSKKSIDTKKLKKAMKIAKEKAQKRRSKKR
ncbi:MAG: phosphotransferase [Methanothermobacter tenebrarum]|nr:phosphotransferase [Methanobacteriaceae archaeon]